MSAPQMPSRRQFLVATGAAGLLVGFGLPGRAGAQAPAAVPQGPAQLNGWVLVAPDGQVTIRCGRAEMGQGVFTGLATLVAEELGCDWRRLTVETGPPDALFKNIAGGKNILAPNHLLPREGGGFADWVLTGVATLATEQFTGGSTSISDGFVRAREAGAVARHMLVQAAARDWAVAAKDCTVEKGRVLHAASGRSADFGQLAARAQGIEPPDEVALKPRADWTLIGTSPPRLDLPGKVDGSAAFALDIRRPGMLFAAVANAPTLGGSLRALNAEEALKLPGVVAVRTVPGGIAAVADNSWRALRALAAVKADWDAGPHAGFDSAAVTRALAAALDQETDTAFETGDGAAALEGAQRRLQAEYSLPYLAHATMEPQTCTAEVTGAGVQVWAPTQAQTRAVKAAADAASVSASDVTLHTTLLGGGFGRRGEVDFIVQAVTLAKELGRPVQVVWSREEDMRHDFYRPATLARAEGALDGDGMPLAWRQRLAGQSIMARVFPPSTLMGTDPTMIEGAAHLPYAVPHQAVEVAAVDLPVPVGPWRAVGHSQNAFISECFLDEMAAAGGHDPLEYRRRLLKDHPRLLAVLNLAAEKAGWGTPLPAGRGRGIAFHVSFGTAVAQVAEVTVGPEGALKVDRVVAAVDCGTVVNPSIVEAQVQGAIAYALSAALFGRISVAGGAVEQGNFPDYEMIRIRHMPAVEVHVVPSTAPPAGIGEPGLPPLAPAVANAIFAATGKRVRSLPLVEQGFTVA
ncbi:MAG TPA: molybdopterin cofactor-binding domain-containing protein [Azospirillaceae bacterium]|nr:molybdopterin cofactor-binding domain-containing protein [Azospirillaceae bacterium]